jgi:hypothetical protein
MVAKKRAAPKKRKQTLTSVGRRLDILARDICKLAADYTCERCGSVGDSSSIEWAHIEPRKKRAIRWSQMNCLALCNSKIQACHGWFDGTRVVSMEWLRENFPEKHAWLLEEVDGVPRAQMRSATSVADRLALEEELKKIKGSYS